MLTKLPKTRLVAILCLMLLPCHGACFKPVASTNDEGERRKKEMASREVLSAVVADLLHGDEASPLIEKCVDRKSNLLELRGFPVMVRLPAQPEDNSLKALYGRKGDTFVRASIKLVKFEIHLDKSTWDDIPGICVDGPICVQVERPDTNGKMVWQPKPYTLYYDYRCMDGKWEVMFRGMR